MPVNKVVDVNGYGMDRYNRILGVIFLGGKNVNLEMVKAGFAEVYRGDHAHGFDPAPYQQAEREAKDAKRGHVDSGGKVRKPQGVEEDAEGERLSAKRHELSRSNFSF